MAKLPLNLNSNLSEKKQNKKESPIFVFLPQRQQIMMPQQKKLSIFPKCNCRGMSIDKLITMLSTHREPPLKDQNHFLESVIFPCFMTLEATPESISEVCDAIKSNWKVISPEVQSALKAMETF